MALPAFVRRTPLLQKSIDIIIIIIIIFFYFFLTPVLNSRGKKKLRYAI